jgi:ubiquitin carboxyl-terminal hydrolase 9/24
VGATVHSGTANAGHYWSYINTKRGYQECEGEDPEWEQTQNDPWMEFNDSTVRDLTFNKIKDDCFGGDGKGGNDDSWGFGGSYGKSAYMLVYERREKKPLKILVPNEEVEQVKAKGEEVFHDKAKDEHFKLHDYRKGFEDIVPNDIYKQVFEDNCKFEFENDIYSTEFFDFVKSIMEAIHQLSTEEDSEIVDNITENAIGIGKKTVMEILSRFFYNQGIGEMTDVLIKILKSKAHLARKFMEQCYEEDNFNGILEILLECPDGTARVQVNKILKFVLTTLKAQEKDIMYQNEPYEYMIKNDKGEDEVFKGVRPKALSARFILTCFSVLNSQVAKNWNKFDFFLDLLQHFVFGTSVPPPAEGM